MSQGWGRELVRGTHGTDWRGVSVREMFWRHAEVLTRPIEVWTNNANCVLVVSFQCFDFVSTIRAPPDTVLHVNDPGFYKTRYSMGDVVGWRLFAMNDTQRGL